MIALAMLFRTLLSYLEAAMVHPSSLVSRLTPDRIYRQPAAGQQAKLASAIVIDEANQHGC